MRHRDRGFSLIELIVILVLMATVALALPRFMNQTSVRSAAAVRRFASDLRFAQRLAVATHVVHGVTIVSPTRYRVFQGTPATPAKDPYTQQAYDIDLGQDFGGVTVGAPTTTVSFDVRAGSPSGTLSFSIGAYTVTVAPETGLVQF